MNRIFQGSTILLVEDDEDTAELLRTIFEQQDAEVITAASVEAAIEAHRRYPAHMVVSDIRLGSSDGFALIAAIRSHDKEYRGFTPAVALTGYSSPGDEERARAAGFDAYIQKPFDPAILTRTVAALLRRSADLAA